MEEINGFYDDDGNKLNPDLYPKPQLCLSCKINSEPGFEDEMLCALNRLGSRNGKEFKCGAYEEM
ncbi:MAG: hypothetical protein WC868_06610 [Bacteroidales bacterium]